MEHASKAPPGEEWGEVVARLHPAGGAGAPVPGMRLTWSRRSVGVLAERNARLIAASHSLAHTVIALEGERDAALARVARLERVLAVEQGEETQGPDGWVWGVDLDDETGAVLRYVWAKGAVRIGGMTSEGWSRLRTGTTMPVGKVYDTALEAMEAADVATSTPTPPAATTAPR
jgi:hypothetical protein